MSHNERLGLYKQIEQVRGRPLIAYVTSVRAGASGFIAGDAIGELLLQLEALPAGTEQLDLLIISNGGDPTVAARIVALIRERVKNFGVLIPEAAFSAATLVALGADEIIMHANGHLGPVDPQVRGKRPGKTEPNAHVGFGSEDLSSFLDFAKNDVGLSDQGHLLNVFRLFCRDVGAVGIGVAARSARLTMTMSEKLLQLHMKDGEGSKAKSIAQTLAKKYYHHGYALGRREATDLGLNVKKAEDVKVSDQLWSIWRDIRDDLEYREPFNPLAVLKKSPEAAGLYQAVPLINLPGNLPQPMAEAVMQQVLQQIQVIGVTPTEFKMTNAVMESTRLASAFVTEGRIFATRLPDLQLRVNSIPEKQSWQTTFTAAAPAVVAGEGAPQ